MTAKKIAVEECFGDIEFTNSDAIADVAAEIEPSQDGKAARVANTGGALTGISAALAKPLAARLKADAARLDMTLLRIWPDPPILGLVLGFQDKWA
jgi:hypothetical protein